MLERENIAKEVDMDSRGVVEVIAKEVDDEKAKETAAENSNSSRKQVGRSTGPVDRRAQGISTVDRSVDRLKAPNSLLGTQSTDRSTGGRVSRPPGRPTVGCG